MKQQSQSSPAPRSDGHSCDESRENQKTCFQVQTRWHLSSKPVGLPGGGGSESGRPGLEITCCVISLNSTSLLSFSVFICKNGDNGAHTPD